MTLDKIRHLVTQVTSKGQIPRTIVLTTADAESMGIPSWTKQLLGLKVVIASNYPESKVVPHFYETVGIRKVDQQTLAEYQQEKMAKIRESLK